VEEIGGPAAPGVGFGAGLERLHLAVEAQEPEPDKLDLFFIMDPDAPRARALAQMATLRSRGLSCDADYALRSVKGQRSQLTRANGFVWVHADAATYKRDHESVAVDNIPVDEIAERILD
jgi:histidyl-tRNA synthetase